MCNCREQSELIDITDNYAAFCNNLDKLDEEYFVLLMQCKECKQLYRIDAWDKLQTQHARKIFSEENWKTLDSEHLIKELMIKSREGLTQNKCMWANCSKKQVKSSAFCIDHIYSSGARS